MTARPALGLVLALLVGCGSSTERPSDAPRQRSAEREAVPDSPEWPVPEGWAHALVIDEFGEGLPADENNVRRLPRLRLVKTNAGDEAYVGRLRTGADTFREVVASWNISTNATVLIEMRVRHADDGSFSPWLRLGHAGDAPADDRSAMRDWDQGAVEVDTIVADVDLDAWQYRLRLIPRAADSEAFPRRVAVVATRSAEHAPGEAPSETRELEVPFVSQFDAPASVSLRVCSPTATAMAMAGLGVEVDAVAFAETARDPAFDLYGNWPRNVQAAFESGVEGYVSRISTWSEATRHLAAGRPLVVSLSIEAGELPTAPVPATPGHLVVIRGFDGEGGVIVSDPAGRTADVGETVYPARAMETVWMSRRQGTCYVLMSAADG